MNTQNTFFYVSCPFGLYVDMALHNFLFSVALGKHSSFTNPTSLPLSNHRLSTGKWLATFQYIFWSHYALCSLSFSNTPHSFISCSMNSSCFFFWFWVEDSDSEWKFLKMATERTFQLPFLRISFWALFVHMEFRL